MNKQSSFVESARALHVVTYLGILANFVELDIPVAQAVGPKAKTDCYAGVLVEA